MRPSELLEALDRWEASGGHIKLLSERNGTALFGLYTCDGGELMSRASGPMSPELRTFLESRDESAPGET